MRGTSRDGEILGATPGRRSRAAALLHSGGNASGHRDQVGLGVSTMHQVGAHIGAVGDITFTAHSGAPRTEPYRVVSQVSFPQFGGFGSLGTGILTTTAGLVHVACAPGPQLARCRRRRPTRRRRGPGTLAGSLKEDGPGPLLAAYPSITSRPRGSDLPGQFGEAVNLSVIFGARSWPCRCGDAGAPARRQRVGPPPGRRAAEGPGLRQPPDRLEPSPGRPRPWPSSASSSVSRSGWSSAGPCGTPSPTTWGRSR